MRDNPIVEFLASYGPNPAANNMYDEFVTQAEKQTQCAPLAFSQPLVDKMIKSLRQNPKTIILTGTAGDGKTYTARKFVEEITGQAPRWKNTQRIYELKHWSLPYGGVKIIKDLSEFKESQKNEIFPKIRDALNGNSQEIFIICVNDGHLLKFFRDQNENEIKDKLSIMLQRDYEEHPDLDTYMFNLSRRSHAESFHEIVDKVVNHDSWQNCAGCAYMDNQSNPCPIRYNRKILQQKGSDSMRQRLIDLVRMAAADERHLSIRHLVMLTVNILLGDSHSGDGLLTCRKARIRARDNHYEYTNPYANVFGENLKESDRKQYGVFSVLGEFQVGYETNNYFDHALLDENNDKNLPQCEIYSGRIFSNIRSSYQANRSQYSGKFKKSLINQRRRLFFSLDPNDKRAIENPQRNPWNLSLYKHGYCYTAILDALHNDLKIDNHHRQQLLLGLNRMMTGMLTDTSNRLWITEPNGVFQGRSQPILASLVGTGANFTMKLEKQNSTDTGKPPLFKIYEKSSNKECITLALRPTILECLYRVAEGALPASFSMECKREVEDIRIRATTINRSSPKMISMERGDLRESLIEILSGEEEW